MELVGRLCLVAAGAIRARRLVLLRTVTALVIATCVLQILYTGREDDLTHWTSQNLNQPPHNLTQRPHNLNQRPHNLTQRSQNLNQSSHRLSQRSHNLSEQQDNLTQPPHHLTSPTSTSSLHAEDTRGGMEALSHRYTTWLNGTHPGSHFLLTPSANPVRTDSRTYDMYSGRVKVLAMLHYPEFPIHTPRFATHEDQAHFRTESATEPFIRKNNSSEKLLGRLVLVHEAYLSRSYVCGYRSDLLPLLQSPKRDKQLTYFHEYPVAPLIVPDSWSFQHFIDGALPKLVQSFGLIKALGAKLLVVKPRDLVITDILSRLGFGPGDVLTLADQDRAVRIRYMVFTCWTPPIHPVLWRTAQHLLRLTPPSPTYQREHGLVVLISRAPSNSHNGGRMLLNQPQVEEALSRRYGDRFLLYDSKWIFLAQSALLGQTYWHVHGEPRDRRGNMRVDLAKLTALLDVIDHEQTRDATT